MESVCFYRKISALRYKFRLSSKKKQVYDATKVIQLNTNKGILINSHRWKVCMPANRQHTQEKKNQYESESFFSPLLPKAFATFTLSHTFSFGLSLISHSNPELNVRLYWCVQHPNKIHQPKIDTCTDTIHTHFCHKNARISLSRCFLGSTALVWARNFIF